MAETANRFWLLERVDPDWDETGQMVVRAADEAQARRAAFEFTGPHPDADDLGEPELARAEWLDPKACTCVEVPLDGPVEVVLSHFIRG